MMRWIKYFFLQFPLRIKRLLRHFAFPFYRKSTNPFPPSGVLGWCSDTAFYLIDVVALPEMYQLIFRIVKRNIRTLSEQEIDLGQLVFGNSINYSLVGVDDKAILGTKKIALAYVSFNMINYRKKLKKEIFIHELVHVWQFQQFGSIYLARAIKAQRSKEGYDYGGVANLYQVMLRGGKLTDFNFEQQADIIEDYYRLLAEPGSAGPMHHHIYEYFVKELESYGDI
jgi:hypothetical protein